MNRETHEKRENILYKDGLNDIQGAIFEVNSAYLKVQIQRMISKNYFICKKKQ